MSTELAPRPAENGTVLFSGASPGEVIAAATETANEFSSVVKNRRLSKRIADREHVLIEGWQVCGALVGVFAVKDGGVTQLAWPAIEPLAAEPPPAGAEPRRADPKYPQWRAAEDAHKLWERHKLMVDARNAGLAYGFSAAFKAIKDGREVGWGEGRCTRSEKTWATRDDYALSSMAQTRGQSRAFSAPLRFVVKLAGYEASPAEEFDGVPDETTSAPAPVAVLDDAGIAEVAVALQERWPSYDGHGFMRVLAKRFDDGIPKSAGLALRAFAWWVTTPAAIGTPPETTTADVVTDAETVE